MLVTYLPPRLCALRGSVPGRDWVPTRRPFQQPTQSTGPYPMEFAIWWGYRKMTGVGALVEEVIPVGAQNVALGVSLCRKKSSQRR